ncbi:proline-tRNA ligase [Striga asiatica]|uniref:Proline-tRNA ligase n=1 Tax=Striga asiatica TaxID=4170 RepID=A0A5A7RHU6_STRAF|nr:proline-tRNA ligase [Striga asiatica]
MINQERDEHDTEILKAVAQAWHGHSASSKPAKPASEFDARRQFFKKRPSRFKTEASFYGGKKDSCGPTGWDFGQSLWDSYEIVSVSKKLETGLVMDEYPFSDGPEKVLFGRRGKESRNSLRRLFNRVSSSRRFTAEDIPTD